MGTTTQLRVMTFNIRYSRAKDGINIWDNRKELVAEVIKKYSPDIVGLQECLADQLDFLKEKLSDYQFQAVGRDDGKLEGEMCPIFYRGMEAIDTGTFWLSNTPEFPSKSWSFINRICTWVRFKTPEPLLVLNTHFGLLSRARLKSIPLLQQKINTQLTQLGMEKMPILIMGDFNFNPKSKEYQAMSHHFQDSFFSNRIQGQADNQITFHEYSGSLYPRFLKKLWHRIDYIWINEQIEVKQSQIILDNPSSMKGVYPSDHWPYLIDIAF